MTHKPEDLDAIFARIAAARLKFHGAVARGDEAATDEAIEEMSKAARPLTAWINGLPYRPEDWA